MYTHILCNWIPHSFGAYRISLLIEEMESIWHTCMNCQTENQWLVTSLMTNYNYDLMARSWILSLVKLFLSKGIELWGRFLIIIRFQLKIGFDFSWFKIRENSWPFNISTCKNASQKFWVLIILVFVFISHQSLQRSPAKSFFH